MGQTVTFDFMNYLKIPEKSIIIKRSLIFLKNYKFRFILEIKNKIQIFNRKGFLSKLKDGYPLSPHIAKTQRQLNSTQLKATLKQLALDLYIVATWNPNQTHNPPHPTKNF